MALSDSQTSPPANWKQKLAEAKFQIRLGHEAACLESLQRQRAINERLVRKAQDGTLGKVTDQPETDMGVNVGNTIHHNYAAPVAATPTPVATQPNANSPSALAKVGIASLLVAAGALGGPLMTSLVNRPAAVAPAAPQIGRDYRLGIQVIPNAPKPPQENQQVE